MGIAESTAIYVSVFLITCISTNLAEKKFKKGKNVLAVFFSAIAILIPSLVAGVLQRHATARPREDRDAQLLLKRAERFGQRGLRHEHLPRRLAQAAALRHRIGVFQLLQCHGAILYHTEFTSRNPRPWRIVDSGLFGLVV